MLATMSAATPPSSFVSYAFSDGGFFPKLHQPQQQHHRVPWAQATLSSSLFGGDAGLSGLLPRGHGNLFQIAKHFSCTSCICELSGYGSLLRSRHYRHQDDARFQKATTLSSCSSVGACACLGSSLQFQQQHFTVTILPSSSYFGCPGFEGLSQKQFTCVWAHSQQHLSLQEDQERLLRIQQRRESLRKHQEGILDSITKHQASLQQTALLSTNSQVEGVTCGYVPPGFDVNSCRHVFVGSVDHKVSEKFLVEVFSTVGPLVSCRLIRKGKSSYGFVEYQDHHAAALAISTLNGRKLFSSSIRVNWAFPGGERGDLKEQHRIFVGDLSVDVTDAELFKFFSAYPSCSDAQVIWDPRSGRSRGFGFVSFREREDAAKAIEEMKGKTLSGKAINCAWAVDNKTVGERPSDAGKVSNKQGIIDNPRYTTVYVGNLAYKVTTEELQAFFTSLGVGSIEDAYIAKGKGYGFIKYSTHEEAALAIKAANGELIAERPIKCSWGTKPKTLWGVLNSELRKLAEGRSSKSVPPTASVQPAEELTLIES